MIKRLALAALLIASPALAQPELLVVGSAHFANPGLTFGTSAFGTISATRLTSREAQLGFRFLF